MPVALVPPTLPSSLLGHTAGWQWSASELDLQRQLATFLVAAARIRGVAVMSSAALARVSPEASRLDPQMELRAGFPYTITHSSAVANLVVKLLFPPAPMKGLITDLDETFWAGIVGEDGVRGVSWTLTDHAAIHGLYQQMLAHLAEMGVLLAVASKNELSVVEEAFERDDLLVEGKTFFPVLANWGPKSESIAEILRVWNIGADGVVFVDDSGLELDEVQQAFPAMKCLQFTKKQPAKVLALLEQLRDLFGKPAVQREDALRQSSIRANASLQAAAADTVDGQFLLGLKGRVAFDCKKDPANKRLLDLINKTNQFNLNGVRVSEGEWLRHLQDRNALVCGVSYEDKFGPLGSIGVLSGVHSDDKLQVTSWVLSCRAFSRKIEDHMLNHLFNHHGVAALRFAFRATDRNQPLRSYLASLGLDAETGGTQELSREQFQNRNEELPHQVRTQDI